MHRSASKPHESSVKWRWSVALLVGLLVVAHASTVEEDATLSVLVFTNLAENEEPQWKDQEIPPLVGGWRSHHASVVVENPENEEEETIVVVGGQTETESASDSVVVFNVEKNSKQWREGPKMKRQRRGHAAVVCNGLVFAIGGYQRFSRLKTETIEYIRVADLLEISMESKRKRWKTLDARLSSARDDLTATVVRNRYIVVA